MNTQTLFLIVGILIIVGGIVVYATDPFTVGDTATTTPTGGAGQGESVLTATYVSDEYAFSMAHATSVTPVAEGPEENHIKFLFASPQQPEGTELQDGYSVTVSAYSPEEYDSLAQLAQAQLSDAEAVGSIIDPLTPTTFHQAGAYRFTSETLGSSVTHVFVASPEWYYQLSSTTVGPQADVYQTVVAAMLASFMPEGGLVDTDTGETDPANESAVLDTVSIAFLDTEQVSSGKERGCDRVVMVEERVLPTTMPLTTALKTLFSLERQRIGAEQWYNFMAKTNDTLFFDRVTVQNGVAKVYLTGELSGLAGVCDDPRAQIQIEETALQFPTVNEVEIYLNDELTELTPSEQG